MLQVEALSATLTDDGRLGAKPAPTMVESILAHIGTKARDDFYQRSPEWSIFDPEEDRWPNQ